MDQHFSFRLVLYLLDILWILQSTRQEVVCFFLPALYYPVGQVYTAWRTVSHSSVAHVAPFQPPNKWREKKPFSSSIMSVHLSVYMFSQTEKRLNSYMWLWTRSKSSQYFIIYHKREDKTVFTMLFGWLMCPVHWCHRWWVTHRSFFIFPERSVEMNAFTRILI